MGNQTLNVLDFFNNTLSNENEKIINKELNDAINSSEINTGKLDSLNEEIKNKEAELALLNKCNKRKKAFLGWMIAFIVLTVIFIVVNIVVSAGTEYVSWILVVLTVLFFLLVILFSNLYVRSKRMYQSLKNKEMEDGKTLPEEINELKNECYGLLNQLFSKLNTNLVYKIIEQTYPDISFNSTPLQKQYDLFEEQLNLDNDSSIVDFHSYKMFGNEVITFKKLDFKMIDYAWVGTERRYNPLTHEHEYKTITRIVPAPCFSYKNCTMVNSSILPNLKFSTENESNKRSIKLENKKLNKYFSPYRNDDSSFFTMFTILAQEEMLKLYEAGIKFEMQKEENNTWVSEYSKNKQKFSSTRKNIEEMFDEDEEMYDYIDEFDEENEESQEEITKKIFEKHTNSWGSLGKWLNEDDTRNLSSNIKHFKHHDLKVVKERFIEQNKKLFKNLYFLNSPLLAIPMFHHFSDEEKASESKQPSYGYILHILNNYFDCGLIKHVNSNTQNVISINKFDEDDNIFEYEINSLGFKGTYTTISSVPCIVFDELNQKSKLLVFFDKKLNNELFINHSENKEIYSHIKKTYKEFKQGYVNNGYFYGQFENRYKYSNSFAETIRKIILN